MKINKTAYLVVANVIALVILAIGLLSPLTPSEGKPALLEVIIFAVSPLLILGLMILKTQSRTAKFIFSIEAVVITSVLARILGVVYK